MFGFGAGKEIESASNGITNITEGIRSMFTGEIPPKMIVELDKIDKEHTTRRWEADSRIKWWESSRSIVLLFLTLFYCVLIAADANDIVIDDVWINSLTNIMFIVYGAFFGGKSFELMRGVNK